MKEEVPEKETTTRYSIPFSRCKTRTNSKIIKTSHGIKIVLVTIPL